MVQGGRAARGPGRDARGLQGNPRPARGARVPVRHRARQKMPASCVLDSHQVSTLFERSPR